MKSQRRHDLQTNELADAIGRFVQRIRPHGQIVAVIAAAAVVLVVVLVAVPIMRSRATAEAAYSFNAAVRAGGTEALRAFLDAYPEAEQGPAARVLLADRLIERVAEGQVEEEETSTVLDEAEGFYTQVAGASKDLEPMARTGLALVMLQRGDLDAGRKALESVVESWPQSVAAAKAKVHLDAVAGYEPVAFSDEPMGLEGPGEEQAAPPPEAPDEPADGGTEVGPAAGEPVPAPADAPAETAPTEETPAEEPSKPVG